MSRFTIVVLALVAMSSFMMKAGDKTKPTVKRQAADTSEWIVDARVDGVVSGLGRLESNQFHFAKWYDDKIVSPVPTDDVVAEVTETPVVPTPAAPVKSGGSNGSYSQAAPVKSGGSNGSYSQAAPVKSGGSNGSYSQAAPVQYSYSAPVEYSYSAPVQYTQTVRYNQAVRSGGSNGSYSQAAPVQYSQPVMQAVPVQTVQAVRAQPYRTVNRAVKSGGCTGSYSNVQVAVPVRGPIRKAVANRRDSRIVSPVSSVAPSYSVAPMQSVGVPDCGCEPVANDGAIVSPYSMAPVQYSAPTQMYATPMQIAPVATAMAPVRNMIDAMTPQRSTSRTICTPEGCVTIE